MSIDKTIITLAGIITKQGEDLEKLQRRYDASNDLMNTYAYKINQYEEQIQLARQQISMPSRQFINVIGDGVSRQKVHADISRELLNHGLARPENVGLSSKDPGLQLTELGKLFLSKGDS